LRGKNGILTQNSLSIETLPEFIAGEHLKLIIVIIIIKSCNLNE
jgi:hypothetical protein